MKSEGEVTQSCPILSDPMDCCLPGCSIHGIYQARVLEWGAISFSKPICHITLSYIVEVERDQYGIETWPEKRLKAGEGTPEDEMI